MNVEFLLDENMPFALIEFLEQRRFKVNHLKRMGKSGIKNGEVYKIAESSKTWIITRDADFENYYRFTRHDVGGIILFKLSDTRTQNLINSMKIFLDKYKEKLLAKHLIIVEDSEIKVYK